MKHSKKKTDPLNRDLSSLFEKKGWKKIQFEIKPKNKTITLRLSEELLSAVKQRAEDDGIDYQKWIRMVLEQNLSKAS